MQSYYANRAPEYDAIYLKPERQSDLRAIEAWLPQRFAGASLLEIACGTGYWTQFLAHAARAIVAVDASPETLAIARGRVGDAPVRFHVGDAYHLDFTPQRDGFNAAFAGFWFSHVPKARCREFLRGLGSCLLPGSRVVLLDNRYVEGSSTPLSESDADGNTYQTRALKDGSRHRVLKNFPTEDDLQALLSGLGGQGRFTAWQYYWAFEYVTVETAAP